MKRGLYWLGFSFFVFLAAYFSYFAFGVLKRYDLSDFLAADVFFSIIAAAFLYSICIPVSGWSWSLLLRELGENRSTAVLSAIMGVTQLAKYVPGNVGQHIGRAALSLAKGIPVGAYGVSVVLETVLAMLSGFFVGAVCLFFSPVSLDGLWAVRSLSPGFLFAFLFVFFLVVIFFVIFRPVGMRERIPYFRTLNYCSAGLAFLGYCVNYILIGFGFWLIALAAGDGMQADFLYLTAVFSLSWLLGFLTPGAPAGLGVREGVMALLLSSLGESDAVFLVIAAMRVATIAGDAFVFVFSVLYIRLCRRWF